MPFGKKKPNKQTTKKTTQKKTKTKKHKHTPPKKKPQEDKWKKIHILNTCKAYRNNGGKHS